MANFLEYNPEQAYLLPPTVREVLGEGHLCFFVHSAVERLDLQEFEAGYSDEGHPAHHPALLLKVWLYAYALGITSSRRLEQRIREDLAFRYLAGGGAAGFWGAERVSQAAWTRDEQHLYASRGVGALAGAGKAGARGLSIPRAWRRTRRSAARIASRIVANSADLREGPAWPGLAVIWAK